MNDRFRFRIYAKNENKMYYQKSTELFDDMIGIKFEHFDDVCNLNSSIEIMQSTGIKDKNGKLIFEGDIVEIHGYFDDSIDIGEIKYEYGMLIVVGKCKTWNGRTDFTVNLPSIASYSTVIGNIYENKNILEESNDLH